MVKNEPKPATAKTIKVIITNVLDIILTIPQKYRAATLRYPRGKESTDLTETKLTPSVIG
jgi:hypothetical protein